MTDSQMATLSKAMAHAGYCHQHITAAYWSSDDGHSDRMMEMAREHFAFAASALGYRIEKIEPAPAEEYARETEAA